MHFFSKKCKNSSEPTRNLIVSVPMFWSTGNHWGLQEDTHYCPNVTCWCVNCQLICMQKLHQFPVCFIYEESLPIDMSTGPNAVDVSTVSSFVCRRSTFVLLPVWQEDTHYCPNPTCWCVNCQLICMQKVHLWNVATLLHIWREHTEPIGMSTCPNAVDVSTVSSFVCRRSIFRLFPVCFIPHFYFLAISQNCHSTQNYEIILKNETIFWNFKENWWK